ncbi:MULTISPECIES: ammonium transporter [Micrococcus]|uniref:Ammonium transporter n=1 Tax=Micrococcus flavus TaxID=384602 RepID=A0A7W7L3E9_9MICC|nr:MULTISPECIES: ammonium transporter [Micrococcus]MBB4882940.1 Amt family ammonium transporter [Micrococcus flavus]GGK41151.1 ammonium transporter [Micrococcus flavus]
MDPQLTPLDPGAVWTMVCAGLVLLMTPGLAFFYGGMTRAKASVNMMMMSFVAMGLVGVVWVLWGYSMTGGDGILGVVGDPLQDPGLFQAVGTTDLATIGFGATFAVISVALISGAVADRAKFSTWCVFVPAWITLVYCPMAFMVWGGGLLTADGAIGSVVGEAVDFAGGLVIHIAAGVAALVLAVMMGKREGFGVDPGHRPHNIPFVMLGAALLWFGWFGFNGGAASDVETAGLIWVNTLAAPAAAMLGWMLVEVVRHGRPTSIGTASGIVAGLVAITPACAFVDPVGSVAIGVVAGVAAALAVNLKFKLGFDDSLDVVGVHLVAGVVGTVMIGLFGRPELVTEEGMAGLFYGGGPRLLVAQVVATVFTVVFAGVVTALIALVLKAVMGLRVSPQDELRGVDRALHAESAYDYGLGTAYGDEPQDAERHRGEAQPVR